MALEPGTLTITVEYAKDPYAVLRVGASSFRTKTHTDGGKNPINDNTVDLTIYDSDVGRDDIIGTTVISLAKAREQGSDHQQAAVRTKSGKQHGFVSVRLQFSRGGGVKAGQHPPAPGYGAPAPAPYPPQGHKYKHKGYKHKKKKKFGFFKF
ncbi:hypothetical protein GPECTOR_95g675 [Gonium pectorale]|uniref:C2 domain-containing protein n=1 Tax=Gonium pectorale TaxID=33097 RepID=A0A150G081_GONPE|nr:hypothetical protein GPECTOR_95g675 [Gonium pectorale]|eukprot:KXZ43286.1 hypothetical protein GPECTOR_95g675 [Gonium pectorale]